MPIEKRIKAAKYPLTEEILTTFAAIDDRSKFPFYPCQQCRDKTKTDAKQQIELLGVPPDDARAIALSRALDSSFSVPLPEGLEMFPFQRAAVEYAQGKNFLLLCDDMGTGKTIQAIGILNAHPDPGRILIICTASLKGNWKNEIEKWSTRPYSIAIVGTGKKKTPEAQATIINYDLLSSRSLPGTFDTVICDESHYLRNQDSQRSQAALPYLRDAKLRLCLTGTPIPTSPYDLWPIISVSGLSLADGYCEKYVIEEERKMPNGYGGEFTYKKRRGKSQDQLQRNLRATCMVRRMKADVLPQLPPKTTQIITIPDTTGAVMGEEVRLRLSALLSESDDFRRAVFARTEDTMDIDGHIGKLRHEQAILKTPHVARHIISILDGSETSKCVVFAHHKDVINLLHEKLGKYFPLLLTGATPAHQRDKNVREFQTNPKHRIFLGNIYAAGEGITLHAAALCVFAEIDWVFAKIEQAGDRLHRIGQHSPVLVQHVVMENSIDEMILRAMVAKQSEAKKSVG